MDILREQYQGNGTQNESERERIEDTLDYFAIMALNGMLSASPEDCDWPGEKSVSEKAYDYAAAMMVEQAKRRAFLNQKKRLPTADDVTTTSGLCSKTHALASAKGKQNV